MADLDDFFAKKDKKKNKSKKFATADEIAKKLEETGKRSEKIRKEKMQMSGAEVDEQGNAIPDEDEWREFEEEKKDYTGLKIQNISRADYDSQDEGGSGGEGDEEGGMEENEQGELVPKKKAGPWRMPSGDAPEEKQPSQEQTEEENKPEPEKPATKTSGVYVPPSLRNQPQAPSRPFGGLRKGRQAPDVHSQEAFPTLSASAAQDPTATGWGKKKGKEDVGFEEVRNSKSHSGRQASSNQMSVTVDNKYGALQGDHQS